MSNVTASRAGDERLTVNWNVVVPAFPSASVTSLIVSVGSAAPVVNVQLYPEAIGFGVPSRSVTFAAVTRTSQAVVGGRSAAGSIVIVAVPLPLTVKAC